MCGINGIISSNLTKEVRENLVNNMNHSMIHRGPDESGFYSNNHCTLAMRRLSIIDISSGKQPIYNENKSILVFLNGEIYNYRELKLDLQKKGHIFSTNSDTEVVVHLYEEYGDKLFTYLNGMFAFCLYDLKKNKWIIARDRFGEKPLFYFIRNDYLSFSSEINSLLQDINVPRTLNKDFLVDYLSNSIIPEPNTLLINIFSLEAGSFLEFDGIKLTLNKYFTPNYITDTNIKSTDDCLDLIKPVLSKAVKSQMISDVPIGAFLSGGIDSSTIVANMQSNSDRPIKTFTVKFDNSKYDESKIAKDVSRYLGTEHNEIFIPNNSFSEDIFWKIIKHVGFPFCDSSAIPTFYITQEIRKFVKVAISGDGGDEIFAGYPIYKWWPKINSLRYLPNFVKNKTKLILNKTNLINRPKGRIIYRALLASEGTENEIGARTSILFDESEIELLLRNKLPNYFYLSQFPPESKNWTTLQKALYYRIKFDLPLDMLTKVDRMSMANSLEVRSPFLDKDLFETLSKIPSKFLIQNGQNKFLLRKLMKDQLPNSVFDHPKSGFSIPLHEYMNDDFLKLCNDLILNNHKMKHLFDLNSLKYFVERGVSQKSDGEITTYRATHQVWSLLQLGGWLNYFNINVEG